MIVKIIGAKRRSGDYQGHPFDKLVLFCCVDAVGQEACGEEVLDTKKTSFPILRAPQICSDVRSYADFFEYVGYRADLTFNQFGNVDSIRIINE